MVLATRQHHITSSRHLAGAALVPFSGISRAARCGLADYRRDRDLKRILRLPRAAASARALETLLAEEERLETIRTSGEATYSLQRHVAVLTALLAEARLVAAA